jgi:hypothetical protein
VSRFTQGWGVRVVSRATHRPIAIFQRYCVHSSFLSLVLYAEVNLIDGRLWNCFYGIAAAAMKRNLPDDQSIRDNSIMLSSRRLVLIYSKLTWDFLMPLTAPEKGRNLLRQLMYDSVRRGLVKRQCRLIPNHPTTNFECFCSHPLPDRSERVTERVWKT